MKLVILTIIFYISFATLLGAEEKGVAVTTTAEEVPANAGIKSAPKRITTAVFMVTNRTSERQKFVSDVKLPDGWVIVTKEPHFELDADESDIRLVSFFIPQITPAGHYQVTYTVTGIGVPTISGSCDLPVTVLPVTKLEVKLLKSPEYAVAGDSYSSSFAIMNEGNINHSIIIKVRSGENLPYTVDSEKLQLEPGGSKTITVTVKTDESVRKTLKHSLELTVQALEDEQTKARVTSHVDIIPRVTMIGDRYHRIPVSVGTAGYASLRKGEVGIKSGLQMEILGEGALDEGQRRRIGFLFRGPDVRDRLIFGRYDEYRLNLRSEDYKLDIGDNTYTLSPLTEKYAYGRGIKGELNLHSVNIGAQYQEPRWVTSRQRKIAGYINYSVKDNYIVGLNCFKKSGPTDAGILSLRGQLEPVENTDVDLEYALGKRDGESDYAYLLRIYGHRGGLSYRLNYIHAEPDYPGYYRDTDSLMAGIAILVRDEFRLNVSFERRMNNLDLDTRFRSAPLERYYQFGVTYRTVTGTNFTFDYRNETSRDRFPQPEFNYGGETYRLGLNNSFRTLNLNTSFEYKESKNNLTDQSYKAGIYNLSTYFRPTGRLSCGGYLQYRGDATSAGERFRSIMLGLDSSFQILERTFLELRLQRDEYIEGDLGYRSSLWAELTHVLGNEHKISLRDHHTIFGKLDVNDLVVEYAAPLGLPVSRKKGIGIVKGRMYNGESLKPIPDVVLRIDGATAVTDEKGYFAFPLLNSGTYYLNVNTARIGMNLVTVQKTPMEVIVADGKETSIEIGIVKGAAISGRIMVYGFMGSRENNHYNGDAAGTPEPSGLANIFVELTDGLETKRRVTDRDGNFSFEELRPGKWTLKVYDYNLPDYHYLEKDIFEFNLKPGDKEDVLIKVLPKERRIRIIEQRDTILKEEDR